MSNVWILRPRLRFGQGWRDLTIVNIRLTFLRTDSESFTDKVSLEVLVLWMTVFLSKSRVTLDRPYRTRVFYFLRRRVFPLKEGTVIYRRLLIHHVINHFSLNQQTGEFPIGLLSLVPFFFFFCSDVSQDEILLLLFPQGFKLYTSNHFYYWYCL